MKVKSRKYIVFEIPIDWTPEQAKAVTEILGHLDEAIWYRYGEDIANIYRPPVVQPPIQNDTIKEDDIPF